MWALIGIVEGMDTSAFHRLRRTGGVGRAGYDPDMLVTLLIWARSQGVRSSRRIERSCADVVSYRVICAGDEPDHVTIARFRAENHAACEQLFGQVLMLAARLGLGRLETVALDGVKIASNASLAANRCTSGDAAGAIARRQLGAPDRGVQRLRHVDVVHVERRSAAFSCSTTRTVLPRSTSSPAATSPARPAPTTMTSTSMALKRFDRTSGSDVHSNGSGVKVTSTSPTVIVT